MYGKTRTTNICKLGWNLLLHPEIFIFQPLWLTLLPSLNDELRLVFSKPGNLVCFRKVTRYAQVFQARQLSYVCSHKATGFSFSFKAARLIKKKPQHPCCFNATCKCTRKRCLFNILWVPVAFFFPSQHLLIWHASVGLGPQLSAGSISSTLRPNECSKPS